MNVIDFLKANSYNGLTDYQEIREQLYKKGIYVSYENMDGSSDTSPAGNKTKRFIFTSSKRSRNENISKIALESNGLILEAPSWKPIVIPPTSPRNIVDTKTANKLLHNNLYDIYYIEDGTIVNLYFYNNEWVISTAKGINVNNVIFNNLPYAQMFNEALEQIGINVDDFYSKLNKANCYTFGFKHPDLHPFMEFKDTPITKVWFVQMVVDVVSYESLSKVIRNSPIPGIPNHRLTKFPIKSMKTLYSALKNAYNDFVNKKRINYGFMLVAKNPAEFVDHPDYTSLLLESGLMNYIRNLWYDSSYTNFIKSREYNRVETILLNSFLDINRNSIFNVLFPQYNDFFNELERMETYIVDKIYNKIKSADPTVNITPTGGNQISVEDVEPTEDNIIDLLVNNVNEILNIHTHERPKQKIRDIIHTPDNIDIFYKLMQILG